MNMHRQDAEIPPIASEALALDFADLAGRIRAAAMLATTLHLQADADARDGMLARPTDTRGRARTESRAHSGTDSPRRDCELPLIADSHPPMFFESTRPASDAGLSTPHPPEARS